MIATTAINARPEIDERGTIGATLRAVSGNGRPVPVSSSGG
jgi:hypothetical protein